jgi:hypothetical protein
VPVALKAESLMRAPYPYRVICLYTQWLPGARGVLQARARTIYRRASAIRKMNKNFSGTEIKSRIDDPNGLKKLTAGVAELFVYFVVLV